MNEEKGTLKFQTKSEIANAIQTLTPFVLDNRHRESDDFAFALDKIKELTKLL